MGALALACAGLGTTPAVAFDRAPGPDPVVERWPAWPFPTSCGDLKFDPVDAFGGPTGAEHGRRPSEVALGKFLRRERWAKEYVPTRDWRLIAEESGKAEFASGRLASRYGPSSMSFEKEGSRWKWTGLGGCRPTSIVRGEPAIIWRLPLRRRAPRRGARRLRVNLGPGPCASGGSQNERARKPIFRPYGDIVLMIMRLRPLPPGGYTCVGIREPALEVEVPAWVGKRKLFDGATYPPVDVVKRWRKRRSA